MKLKRVFKSAISLFLVFLLTFGMVIIPPFAQARESIKTFDKSLDVVTDRFIIKYKSDTDKEKIKDVLKYKLQSTRKLGNNKNFDIFITKNKMKTDDLLSEIKLKKFESSIDYIQPDYSISLSSNDPYFSYQWGLENNTVSGSVYGQSIDANVPSAWLESEGSGVIVAVIDTGVDITHEDLADNIWVNTNEIPNNNIDDDNNGYIDDTQGWNFYDDNNTVHEISNLVDEQHGTHETGIISAVKDNGKGITGVAPKAKVLPLKAFSNGTAYTSDIIEAIEYAERNGAKVVNCSWGTTVENSALKETIDLSNMLFACAAGNNGVNIDLSPVYPAAWPNNNIITVASINKDGYLSSFSNYGVNSVDIAAPGEGIMSTLPGNQYGQMSGTSMATPFVSGTIALLPAIYPNISTKEIKTRIEGNTTLLPQFSGKISSGGMLNVCKVITSSESTIIRSPIIDTGDGIESENINKNRSNYFDTKSVQIQSIIVQEGFEGGTLTSSSFTDTYNLPGCSSSITTDQSKVISGMYSFNGKAPTSTEWYDCLYTDRTKVILQAGTTYKVSFNTKTISSPGSGGWFYFLARTPTGGVAQDVNISDWTENVGSITTKSFEFTLKGFDDYYLMWGLRNGGELSIDDIKITYVGITQKDVDWGFEKGSLETSYFTGTYDLAGCSSTITTDPLKVISGMYSFDGKAPITTEWYDCLYTDRSKIMLKANTTYKVSFNTKTISSPGSGGWFYFLARTPTGGVAQDVNISGWTENVGSITTKSFEFTLKGFDDYYLMWGLRNGGELSIDDIQITKASATQESMDWGFERGSFESSNFTDTSDVSGCSSTITTDPSKVITGMYSFNGKALTSTGWYDCLYTDKTKVILQAGATYKVSFNTKTISNPGSGGWFYFLARTPTGGVYEDVGINTWTDNPGNTSTKSFEFTLKGYDDYYLIWGLRSGGELSIDDIQITSPINLGQTVNGTISGFNTENRYKVNIPQAGVMTANLNVTSGSNYYTVEFYDSNNSLLRKVNNYLTSNSKFMVDVQTPGNYYIKVIKSSTIDLNYTLQVNRKDKLELIQTESDSVNTKLALKVNNPRSIKNAAIVLEYNPTYYSDASSQAANMFENLIGLKTIAVKRIPGVSTSKIVFYYDMEDDFAANMEDQEVIIDYITFNKTSIQGPSIITISPESYVGLYDSTKFILNNGVSFTVSSTSLQTVTSEVYSQAVTQLTSQGSAGITVFWKPGDILDRLDPAIIQRNPKAIEQLRAYKLLHSSVPNSVYGSVYGNVYGGMYNSVYSSVYSGNPSNFKISSVGEVSTFSSLFDPNSYSTISGVIRTPVGSGMNPEKIRVTITDTSTKNTATPVSRSTYPDKTGRFIFKYVPSGINFTISVQDANNLTQSPVEKSIFSSVAKDIGGVLNGEALFVQDIGYFYQFDFNGNGVYNESDEGEYFFNQISTTGVTSGNYLYSGTTTSLSDNPSLNLDKDSEVNVFEASNATTNTWLDNPVDPGSVDTNRYRAEPYSDNIPSSVTPGSSGEFTISFIDNYSETITEDGVKSIAYPDKYYKLVRIDTDSDITISNIQFLDSNTVTIDGVDYHNPRFKMNYMISGNNTKPSYTLKFMLANNSSLKEGYGIPLEKTITNSSYTGTDNVDDTNFDSIKVWKDSAGVEYTLVYVKNGGVAISFKSPSSAEVSFDAIGLKNAVYDILALNDWSNENFLAVTGSKSAIDNAIDNKQGAWAQITKESYEYYTYIYMESQNRLSTYYQRQQFASIAESCVSLLVGIGILAYESRIISMARNRAAFQTGTVILKDTQIMSVARTDTAIAKISDEVALAEEITDTLPSQAIQVGRPSWRQSELDAAADFADYASQKSFIKRVDGTIEECAYGTPGSVRPDLYKSGYSIDVKNYNITTTTGRNNLANNIYNQYLKRVVNLPSGTQQTVLIDARGQVVTDSMIDELVGLINNKTGSNVRVRFMR